MSGSTTSHRSTSRRTLRGLVGSVAVFASTTGTARAHVDYVTDPVGGSRDPIAFAASVLADPLNAALFGGGTLVALVALVGYLRYRPTVPDLVVLREHLSTYHDLVPWMIRLSVGLPLVGAGFQGYLFAPVVAFDPAARPVVRLWLVALGFFVLFGLATRVVSALGVVTYGWAVGVDPGVVLAFEYVPAFLALVVLGSGRPSADDMLRTVAETPGTTYGRVDPVHHVEDRIDARTAPYRPYVATVLRMGLGATFAFLGLTQKLGDPSRSLAVVTKYDLTSVVPVDPGAWVLGAGVLEIAVGLALVVGFLTRASAAVAFALFTLTLFGLPDDPVLAHVTLFGIASAVFTLGAGPLSLDRYLSSGRGSGEPTEPAPQ